MTKQELLSKYKASGYRVDFESPQANRNPVAEKIATTTQEQAKKQGGGVKNFFGGALYGFSSLGRTIQDAAPALFSVGGQGAATKDEFEQTTGTDLDTTAGKVGEFAGELAPYLATPGGALKSLPTATRVLTRGGINTAIGAGQEGDLGEGAKIGVGGELLAAASRPLAAAGKFIYKGFAIPLSKQEAGLVQSYKANEPFVKRFFAALGDKAKGPVTADETAFAKGLMGTESMIGVQAVKANKKIWSSIVKPALKASPEKVEVNDIFAAAEKRIIKTTPELSRQKQLLKALESFKEDYAGVEEVSLSKLQDIKSGWDKFIPAKAFRGEDVAGAANTIRKELADIARNTIHSTIDDPVVRRAYTDYGNLKGLQQWGQTAMTGGKFKGGAGAFLNALKDAVVTPVATIGGQVIYKTANGIEFVSGAGAKTLHDIFNEESLPSTEQPVE